MLRRFLLITAAAFLIIGVARSGGRSDIEPADSYAPISSALESVLMKLENKLRITS
jgi:hypothetical protein